MVMENDKIIEKELENYLKEQKKINIENNANKKIFSEFLKEKSPDEWIDIIEESKKKKEEKKEEKGFWGKLFFRFFG